MICTLAQPYDQNKVIFPALVSTKLDGIRGLFHVLADGEWKFESRDEKPIRSCGHIVKQLLFLNLPVGTVLDGELYIEDTPFQKVSGLCRRHEPSEETLQIQYYIFDLARFPGLDTVTSSFRVRFDTLSKLFQDARLQSVRVLPHFTVRSHQDIMSYAESAVAAGAEGAIIRTDFYQRGVGFVTGGYRTPDSGHSDRTYGIQKVKFFEDAEFLITGIFEEIDKFGTPKGRAAGFTFQDLTNPTITFQASGLTDAMKHAVWSNPEQYIGETATVKFFGRSTEGTPRHPNFKALRPLKGVR